MGKAFICFTTMTKEKEAKKLARALIQERLAGCVQVLPKMSSFYEWDGAVQEDKEYLMIMKLPAAKLESIKQYIIRHHPYEIPEFVAIDITDGLPTYLQWLDKLAMQS